jgi:tRNA pseudouridine32 synthase/23S rRNA pseudouridine746 synthase
MTTEFISLNVGPEEIPEAFPSPFDQLGPHPLALRAAALLQAELQAELQGVTLDGGKMFGVLVVRGASGATGYLRAFSGMLQGKWLIPGFVPPAFDMTLRARVEPAGEQTVKSLWQRAQEMAAAPELAATRQLHEAMAARHQEALSALRVQHERHKHERHAQRAMAQSFAEPARSERLHQLDQLSRGDKAERRRLEESQAAERLELGRKRQRLERRLLAMERLRQFVGRRVLEQLQDTYEWRNRKGERRRLRSLFEAPPPAGAGDCAAPKLLAHALACGLTPLALAEFWWGPPPLGGGRVAGHAYAACKDKCAPILPFLLEGLAVAPPRLFTPPDLAALPLRVVFEDEWLVVVDKPHGLLSVPGRDAAVTDSVRARLRARHPDKAGLLLAHRLDLDTSGLLVAAKDARTHAALQRQFARREVEKRYVAWVDGVVLGEAGVIDLPIRVDLDDRPRQIHDPVHGKSAVTGWQVLARTATRTKLALAPHTGRTHQLRVHCAHRLGLGAAIVGDRLYGSAGERLLLHAERITFVHPKTGLKVTYAQPAPF